ncbi:hypothetical protein H6P81_005873 [Aristolochia fimbriata]|uniref:Uncharacterized protein n=1 Tax=Aristolochia fimbriata TaxID=158543 RepID=A0AAV7EWP2_ARIFI|nr:hypothetical protein H6P81_005873 [Aristolochia fimbriata]
MARTERVSKRPAPPRYNRFKFVSMEASNRYKKLKKKKMCCSERGFMLQEPHYDFTLLIRQRGWKRFCEQPGPTTIFMVREFYTNIMKRRTTSAWCTSAKGICDQRLEYGHTSYVRLLSNTHFTRSQSIGHTCCMLFFTGQHMNVGLTIQCAMMYTSETIGRSLYFPSLIMTLCKATDIPTRSFERVIQWGVHHYPEVMHSFPPYHSPSANIGAEDEEIAKEDTDDEADQGAYEETVKLGS